MRISQKGLYALQAASMLSRHYKEGAIRIHDIAAEEHLSEGFLRLIFLELKNARIVGNVRGARGGYRLMRPPQQIFLSEIIRRIDGPLAPFGDAESLRTLISNDAAHRPLFRIFMDVRDAAARILENTSLADISGGTRKPQRKSQVRGRPRLQDGKRRRES
jgi:Rrf2 family cysteine metabolism transcriptional repressor